MSSKPESGFTEAELAALERRFFRNDWRNEPATPAQRETITRLTNAEPPLDLTKGEARRMLAELLKDRAG